MAFNAGELVATLRADLGAFARDMATAQAGLKQTGAVAAEAGKKSDAAGKQTAAAAKQTAAAAKESGAAAKQAGAAAAAGAKQATAAATAQGAAAAKAGDATASAGRKATTAQREAAAAARAAEKAARDQRDAFTKVGTVVTGFGVAALAGFGLAVHAAADFGSKMAQLQSLSHATNSTMVQASTAAMSVGQAYGFSATQVAEAQIELQKAGVSVTDQLGGALKGALVQAAAGQIDLGQSTEISTIAMTQFGLKAAQIPHVADLLAAGADKALGGIGDLGYALKSGGLVASQFGMSIDDTVGTLSAFANAGLIGENAGTTLRQMLLQLANPSKQATAKMDELGISAYDAQGKFVGITALAGQLNEKLGTLSQKQRDSAEAIIFGSHAINGANVLFKEGASGIAGWISNVNDSGFAAQQAAGKLDSLAGDGQKLAAVWQTDLIKAGSSVSPMLRTMTQDLTGVLTAYGNLPAGTQSVVMGSMAVVGAIALVGGGALLAIPKLAELKTSLKTLGVSASGAARGIGVGSALFIGLAALTTLLSNTAEQVAATKQQIATGSKLMGDSWSGLDNAFGSMGNMKGAKSALDNIASSNFFTNNAGFYEGIDKLTGGITHLGDVFKSNSGVFAGIGQQLADLANRDLGAASSQFQALAQKMGGGTETARELLQVMPAYKDALAQAAQNAHKGASDQDLLNYALGRGKDAAAVLAQAERDSAAAGQQQAAAVAKIQGASAGASVSVSQLAQDIKGLGSTTLDAHSAERSFKQAIDDARAAVDKNGKTLDLNTQAGRDNQASLENIATTALASASSIETLTGNSAKARKEVQNGRDAFVKQATAILGSKTAAEKYADSLGLIPNDVEVLLRARTSGTKGLSDAKTYIEWLQAHNATTVSVAAAGLAGGKNQATGGEVSGPGPKGVDSVPTMLAPGEHVLTASDVDRMGGQANVYAFRSGLQNGDPVQHFAAGGAVQNTGSIAEANRNAAAYKRQADNAQKALTRAQRAQAAAEKRAKASAAAYQKAADHASSIYGNGTAKEKHAAEMRARALKKRADADAKAASNDQKAVDKQTKTRDAAKQKRADQQTRAAALSQTDEDLSIANVRGQYIDASNPLGAADYALQSSRDTNFRPGQRKVLDALAKSENRTLEGLSKQAAAAATAVDSATTSLGKATDTATNASTQLQALKDSAAQLASGIASTVRGFFGLGGTIKAATTAPDTVIADRTRTVSHNAGTAAQWDEQVVVPGKTIKGKTTPGGTTVAAIRSSVSSSAAQMRTFASDLKKLQSMGYSLAVVTDVANLGVEQGSQVASALLSGKRADVSAINAGYVSMSSASNAAGQTIASATYGGQINTAQKSLDVANQQVKIAQATLDADKRHVDSINKSITDAQTHIVKAIEHALSGSATVKHALGAYQPQIQPAGANVLWAERETGGEAFIPFAMDRRPRALAILQQTAMRLGQTVIPAGATTYAAGGIAGAAPVATSIGGDTYDLRGAQFGADARDVTRELALERRRRILRNEIRRVNP